MNCNPTGVSQSTGFLANSSRPMRHRSGPRKSPNLVQGQSRSTKLLMALTPAPLVKHVMPGLTFLAKKTG